MARLEAKLDLLLAAETLLGGLGQPQEDESKNAFRTWSILAGRKWVILGFGLIFGLAGFLLSLFQPPAYQARAMLEILERNESPIRTKERVAEPAAFSPETYLQTRIDLLRSESLLRHVAEQMGDRRAMFESSHAGFGNLINTLKREEPERSGQSKELEFVTTLQDGLNVRPARGTSLVQIMYEAPDPKLAADVANAIAKQYIVQDLEVRREASVLTKQWLSKELQDAKQKLEDSEQKLQQYAQAANLLLIGGKDSLAEDKLRHMEQELARAETARVAKQSQYEAASTNPSEPLTEALNSGSLREYQVKLTELRRELADLTALYTQDHPKVKRVRAQITELDGALDRERKSIVGRSKNEFQAALAVERRLASIYRDQSERVSTEKAKAIKYNVLLREVETNRNLYDAMLQGFKEVGVNAALRRESARIVDAATPPSKPSRPKPSLYTLAGLLLGLCAGAAFVVGGDRMDRTVRQPGSVTTHLNVAELGVIPTFPYPGNTLQARALLPPSALAPGDGRERGDSAIRGAMVAEGFRSTLTSLLFSRKDGRTPKVIVITSCDPAEGKSTVTSNLGLAVAEIGQRVLIIGGDLRNPKLHVAFNVEPKPGLSDILRDHGPALNGSIDKIVSPTAIPNVYVLPSGTPTVSTANLLHSRRMADLLAHMRHAFDMVLIDSPPLLAFADTRVLARYSDGVVLVVRAGRTTRDSVEMARKQLAADGTVLLGTILNDWRPDRDPSSYYYYHSASYPDASSQKS
ncbi:MAG: polysaccharide biosynthesis tyrosine autokinase [Bryobacteraceae bacterium]|nr:polysaccharide biosynthesis tyrosine autokinase [Bryobacteraceae bacterium]